MLSPVSGVFCHRCLRDTSRKIDATVAAPGPHDFAVRSFAVVARKKHAASLRPSHSGPTYVTIARYVPFGRTGTGEYMPLIWIFWKEEYFLVQDLTRLTKTGIGDLPVVLNLQHPPHREWRPRPSFETPRMRDSSG